MILKALTKENLETARLWRNELMAAWRTPYMLTQEMQEDFYERIICDRRANLRYWGFHIEVTQEQYKEITGITLFRIYREPPEKYEPIELFIGFGGIENICWEAHTGEISILIDPEQREKGYGEEALRLILDQSFNYLGLDIVHAECYLCNDSLKFWDKMAKKYEADEYTLPYRKYWQGKHWHSLFFYFVKDRCKLSL